MKPNRKMVVQLDIDDTITWAPEFFSWLSRALRRDGHRVLIVTARGKFEGEPERTEAELRKLGIVWDKLVLSEIDPELVPGGMPEDFPQDSDYLWPKLNAAMGENPDIIFDDSEEVAALCERYLPEVKVMRPIPFFGWEGELQP